MYRRLAGGLALLVLWLPLQAATTILIPDVHALTGTVPDSGAVTVIDRETIELSNATTLAEVLSAQAGLQVTDLYGDGTTTTVDVRGFGATAPSNVLILVDGRRLNNSADIGAPALNHISLDQVERIEISRGSAGVRLGNQAVGGVVNIVTRDLALPAAFVEVGAGSYDELAASGGATLPLGAASFLRLSAQRRETDNYRDHNRLTADLVDATLEHRYGTGRLVAQAGRARDALETPGSLFPEEVALDRRMSAAAYADDYADTDALTARLGLQQSLGDAWQLDADLNWRQENRRFLTSFRAFPGGEAAQDRRTWRFTPRLATTVGTGPHRTDLLLGLDIERTDYRLDSQFGIQAMDQEVDGIFAEAGIPLVETLGATLGVRHTRVRNRIENGGDTLSLPDGITTGTLTLDFTPAEDWKLFARADQNFRLAAVDEHTNVIFGQPAGLENQRGTSLEAGAEWHRGGNEWRLTMYRLDLNNEISFNADTFTNVNLDHTRRVGGTIEGRWRLRRDLHLDAQFTYTDGKITDGPFTGNRIPLVSRHIARLGVEGRPRPEIGVLAELVHTGDQPLGGDYENAFPELDAYTVANAAFTYEFRGWRVRARVDNVFGERYKASGAIGLDEAFQAAPAYFPAPERRFSLSLRHDF